MPEGDVILRLVERATASTLQTSSAKGHLVQIENASDVFVAGDLHGHVGHFQSILRLADLAGQPNRHLVVQELIHGPFAYGNGSDKSHQLLDLFAALKAQFPHRVHFLPGNHEIAQATARPIARSAGELNVLFRNGIDTAYGDYADRIYSAYLRLIFASPLAIRTSNRVFMSHSLPPAADLARWNPSVLTDAALSPEQYHPGGSVYPLVWGRDVSAEAAEGFLKIVDADLLITGHLPCQNGYMTPNERQIVLDSQEPPAACCLFPADRPITHADLVSRILIL